MTDPRSELEQVITEMRDASALWREAYPNGGTGRRATVNFANWIDKFANRLSAILQRLPQETKEPT